MMKEKEMKRWVNAVGGRVDDLESGVAEVEERVETLEKELSNLRGYVVSEFEGANEDSSLVTLTQKQCTYLSKMARLRKMGQIIERTDNEGWIFVIGSDDYESEGAGIWVDPNGEEHQGPSGWEGSE